MNDFDSIIKRITVTRLEPGDYTGEDGLLYCGKCRTPKQFRMEARRHRQAVADLKSKGFTDLAMRTWTFANDNGKCPQMKHARFYVENWPTMQAENIGYLLWGGVGTGKSYFAGCIANALMEREITVRMTNFALILNDLTASFEGRNEYISQLCRALLLIIDDFGMERGTEYGLEQVYNVIDSRYRSRRPLIVTTNLSLQDLQHPQDTAHARIYDRLLEMCAPIRFRERIPQGHSAGQAGTSEKSDGLKGAAYGKSKGACYHRQHRVCREADRQASLY